MMKKCPKCGQEIDSGSRYCYYCGADTKDAPSQPYQRVEPVRPVNMDANVRPIVNREANVRPIVHEPAAAGTNTAKAQKKPFPTGALIGILAGVEVIITVLVLVLTGALITDGSLPEVEYAYQSAGPAVDIEYEAVDTVYPALYNSLDYILSFSGISDNGDCDVLVRVEIPGFTQVFEQKFTLTEQITRYFVHPPVLAESMNLNSAKMAQIDFSVTELDSDKIVMKETVPVRLMSKYDIEYYDNEYGMSNRDNYLAFLTPEDKSIVELKRDAIDVLSSLTNGGMDSFVGYQRTGAFENDYEYTYYQALALQIAMSELGVRYNMSPYSSSGTEYLQRVLLPADVLETRSGLCVETSIVIASAIQSANMHAMLVFPTGHAQVAVETWQGSGEYYLIETTTLPVTAANMNSVITYLTPDDWANYITNGTDGYGCYVVDLDHAKLLNIQAVAYSD